MQRKFTPATPVLQVEREEKVQEIIAQTNANFTVFVAPVGYGKSCLAEQWVKRSNQPYGWLNLDSHDDQSRRFWSNLSSALCHLVPDLEHQALPLLTQSSEPDYIDFVDWLIDLIEQQGRKWNRPTRYFLVIDNFSLIENAQILHAFNRFIDYCPHWLHVVVLCRKQPLVNLSERLAKGGADTFGNEMVSFNVNESGQFVQLLLGKELSPEATNEIFCKTEGWPALIHILCVSLRAGLDLKDALSSSQYRLSDFLMHQLYGNFSSLQKQICDVMSIPSKFDKNLVDALFDQEGLLELDKLVNRSSIALPLSENGSFLQFAPLFREWLQNKAKSFVQPDLIEKIITYFKHNEDIEEAIEIAVRYERWAEAVEMTERQYKNITGHVDKILAPFPEHIIESHPYLLIVKALNLFSLYQYKQVNDVLDKLKKLISIAGESSYELPTETVSKISLAILFLETHMLRLSANTQDASRNTHELLALLSDTDSALEAWCYCGLMIDAFMDDNIHNATELGFKALSLAKDSMDIPCFFAAFGWLLPSLAISGKIPLAMKVAESNLHWIKSHGLDSFPDMLFVEAQLVALHREAYALDTAWQTYNGLQKWFHTNTDPRNIIHGKYSVHIDLLVTSGELKLASACIDALEAEVKSNFAPNDFVGFFDIDVMRAIVDLKQGRKKPLIEWYQKRDKSKELTRQLRNNLDLLACLAEILLRIDCEESLRVIKSLALKNGAIWRSVKADILLYVLLNSKGRKKEGEDLLQEALLRAKDAGYLAVFVEEVNTLAPALKSFIKDDMLSEYCHKILNASKPAKPSLRSEKNKIVKTDRFVEGLTERELEVLKLVGEGLSNQLIADGLHISLSTVKNHLGNIYGKLSVKRRTEAISVARNNNLI